jgi:hypothetical protein
MAEEMRAHLEMQEAANRAAGMSADELRERMTEGQGNYAALLPFRFTSYAKHSTSFASLGSERGDDLNLVANGEPTPVRVSLVTDGFFPALGVGCEKGRLFLPEEYDPARAGEVVVVSHSAWTKFFGQDPELVGKDIQLGERLRARGRHLALRNFDPGSCSEEIPTAFISPPPTKPCR